MRGCRVFQVVSTSTSTGVRSYPSTGTKSSRNCFEAAVARRAPEGNGRVDAGRSDALSGRHAVVVRSSAPCPREAHGASGTRRRAGIYGRDWLRDKKRAPRAAADGSIRKRSTTTSWYSLSITIAPNFLAVYRRNRMGAIPSVELLTAIISAEVRQVEVRRRAKEFSCALQASGRTKRGYPYALEAGADYTTCICTPLICLNELRNSQELLSGLWS